MFSPHCKEGFGLTDGEMLERVWSYVRRFGKMTKEMRPSHWVDVLTDVLLHYGMETKNKIEVFVKFNITTLNVTLLFLCFVVHGNKYINIQIEKRALKGRFNYLLYLKLGRVFLIEYNNPGRA